ncbi:hypothetical protein ACFOY4_23935 [Actinomadura syzygii]|uniref:hypothetical protein n=1 Tax=Actinomadura syzygii TaxID=1427538 RepID=UPI001651BF0D|nr:hypothetical protein [Actinomadura syzygii]
MSSGLMYKAGIASIGLAFASWAASGLFETAGLDRADRWGIFIGEWAPTFFAMGIALQLEEMRDTTTHGRHHETTETEHHYAAGSAVM